MPDPLSDQPVLRFLGLQVTKQGYLKVIAVPVTALAAIGSAFAFLGSNWLLFGTVVGGGTCILVLLLLAVEHIRSSSLQLQIADLDAQLADATDSLERKAQQNTAAIRDYSVKIEQLQELISSVRWITERMAVCCSKRQTTNTTGSGTTVYPEDICKVSEFDDLEAAVLDYAFDFLGPSNRRMVIYYGDATRLMPAHKPGWPNTHPRVLVAGQPKAPLEVNATSLLDALRNRPVIYVPDLTRPNEEERRFIDIVPDHHDYPTLACFRLASLPSVWAESTDRATLLGALLVQDTRVDALANVFERQFFTVLANVLATGFLGIQLNLMKAGRN